MERSKLLLSPERAGKFWRLLMCLTALWIGAGYAIGPPFWYQSPTLHVLQLLPVPIPVWGWAMMAGGVLVATPWRTLGHFISFAVFGFWSCCIAVNAVANLVSYAAHLITGHYLDGTPPIASWGGDALFLVLALVHAHQMLAPLTPSLPAPVSEPEEDT